MKGSKVISVEPSSTASESLIVYGTGLVVTVFAGFYFHITGYPPVVTAMETLDITAPPLYMIPIFFPFGILLGELLWIWIEQKGLRLCILLFLESSIIAAFSSIRIILGLPFSGHAIILSFFIPYQVFNNKYRYPFRVLIGFFVLFITMFFKVFLWNDPVTFFLGLIVGIVLWFPGFVYRLKYIDYDLTANTQKT